MLCSLFEIKMYDLPQTPLILGLPVHGAAASTSTSCGVHINVEHRPFAALFIFLLPL